MSNQIFCRASNNRSLTEGHVTSGYVALKENVFPTCGWALNNFNADDLVNRNAWIGVTLSGGAPVSAAHVVIDGAGIAHLQGMITDPMARQVGLGAATLSFILGCVRDLLGASRVELVVRVSRDGQVNKPGFALFQKIGFQATQEILVPISGLPCDVHLRSGAEGGGRYIRILAMQLDLARWHP